MDFQTIDIQEVAVQRLAQIENTAARLRVSGAPHAADHLQRLADRKANLLQEFPFLAGVTPTTPEQQALADEAAKLEAKAIQLEAEQKAQEVLKDIDQSDPAQLRLAAKSLRERGKEVQRDVVEAVEATTPAEDPAPVATPDPELSVGQKVVQWLKS